MSRTLRGFDTEFPYLGARGDVTDGDVPDAGLVAKEEDYGSSDIYFHISDRVADEMFGADDDFGAHGFDDFGTSPPGAVGTMLQHRYGFTEPPPGYTLGPRGRLIKIKPTSDAPSVPQSPQAAAGAARHLLRGLQIQSSDPHKTVWDLTSTSWQISTGSKSSHASIDKQMAAVAHKYNVYLFRATLKKGSPGVTYIFTLSPRSVSIGGRLAGYTLAGLNKPS